MNQAFFIALFLLPALAIAGGVDAPPSPKLILHKLETVLSTTKNFDAQNKRVLEANCAEDVKDLSKSYAKQRRFFFEAENILDDAKHKEVTFASLPQAERDKLKPLFPEDFGKFISQMNQAGIAKERLALVLATMMRETDFQMFLDEDDPGIMLKGPGTRPGAGLFQMTAWNLEYVEKWGPHDFDKFDQERLRGLLQDFRPNPKVDMNKLSFRDTWLPLHVELGIKKNEIATANQFKQSPYNPVSAFWYGNFVMKEAEKKIGELGIKQMKAGNKEPILGVFYNAGINRLRCAADRVKVWNDYYKAGKVHKKESYELRLNEWESLRPMLYLHKEVLEEANLPEELISKLEKVCEGKKECSCLDQEPATQRSALKANDFKAAVSTSYGNHMRLLGKCYEAFVQEHELRDKGARLGCHLATQ